MPEKNQVQQALGKYDLEILIHLGKGTISILWLLHVIVLNSC